MVNLALLCGNRLSIAFKCSTEASGLSLTVYQLYCSKYKPEVVSAARRRCRENLTSLIDSLTAVFA
jgi:hypothetical protein